MKREITIMAAEHHDTDDLAERAEEMIDAWRDQSGVELTDLTVETFTNTLGHQPIPFLHVEADGAPNLAWLDLHCTLADAFQWDEDFETTEAAADD